MRAPIIAMTVAALVFGAPRESSAQFRGFATLGMSSDTNDQFPGINVGASVDLANSWVSVGGHGELFMSDGYFGGRGGPFAQLNLLRRGSVRPFIIGGHSFGVAAGSMVGAGIEVWPKGRLGLRATVQDYIARFKGFNCSANQQFCDEYPGEGLLPSTYHQLSVHFGIVWR